MLRDGEWLVVDDGDADQCAGVCIGGVNALRDREIVAPEHQRNVYDMTVWLYSLSAVHVNLRLHAAHLSRLAALGCPLCHPTVEGIGCPQ